MSHAMYHHGNIRTAITMPGAQQAGTRPAPCAGCGEVFLLRQTEDIPQHNCRTKSYQPHQIRKYNEE